ncbi:MAG: hypothetical protein IPM52_11875 [Bacteroidetes bacterium]|nr:hypothetical protein [Bacteroidota bacterium]
MAIGFIAFAITLTNLNNGRWKKHEDVVAHDVIGYYCYLPAAFVHHDLSFSFVGHDPESWIGKIHVHESPTGGRYIKMTMGLALLYLPFFLIGHLTAWLGGWPMDGFSPPYMFWLQFSALFYLLAGLFALRKVLLDFFDEKITALVLLLIVLGTNLFHYSTLEAAMSHAYNFSLFSLFILLGIRWHRRPEPVAALWLGIVSGLIVLIRPTNGIIALFFILWNVQEAGLMARIRLFLSYWQHILIILLAAFIVLLPQLFFWKANTGSWLFYSYGEEGFFFDRPRIWLGLFSYRKGWLIYTPLMLFALAGIPLLRKKAGEFFWPIVIMLPLHIYIIFSWWDFSYGGSFGARPMIEFYTLLSLPLAALLWWLRRNMLYFRGVLMVMLLLVGLNLFQTLQYKYGILHFAEMSGRAYWASFGKLKVDPTYYDLMEPLDYSRLIKGEYATKVKLRNWIYDSAHNDFEQLNEAGTHYVSPDRFYEFLAFESRDSAKARSGRFSARLHPDNPFASGIDFFANPDDRFEITVWKKPAFGSGVVVIAGKNVDALYRLQALTDSVDQQGWGRMRLEITIPETDNKVFRVYLWNNETDTVYMDDLVIRKLKNQ